MWEWLLNALCQKPYQKTHVWNLENQKHLTIPRQKRKTTRGPQRDAGSALVELDWKQGRRMDSYFIEASTQTIIREEVYKKVCLQKKSPFQTKDLFSISMRNVNEKILNERSIVVPARPDGSMDPGEMSSVDNSEQDFLQVVHVQVESTRRDSRSSHRQEDMDTMVTDVDEEDSIENGVIVRDLCSDHTGMCLTETQEISR